MYGFGFGFFFLKQKTAYEMRISDWSSDVCSSDLRRQPAREVDVDSLGHAASDLRLSLAGGQKTHVIGIGDIAGFEEHGWRVRRLQHDARGEAVIGRADLADRRCFTLQQLAETEVYSPRPRLHRKSEQARNGVAL